MANDITLNPIVVDVESATNITTGTFKIYMIRWVSASAGAGDLVTVQDKNGNFKWGSVAAGSNYVEQSHLVDENGKSLIFEGLKVPTLGSGTLYFYISSSIPIKT